MDNVKNKITSKFDKSKFELLNCETAPDGSWDGIDEYIRDFIKEINKKSNISTIYSCEGHNEGDTAYLYFNVDEIGWDIFWLKVLPELAYNFCQPMDITGYIPDNPNFIPYYKLQWEVTVTDNEYNSGISLYSSFMNFEYENDNCKIMVTWEEKKKRFWDTVQEIFTKHYN